jgi:hypothetical protein
LSSIIFGNFLGLWESLLGNTKRSTYKEDEMSMELNPGQFDRFIKTLEKIAQELELLRKAVAVEGSAPRKDTPK